MTLFAHKGRCPRCGSDPAGDAAFREALAAQQTATQSPAPAPGLTREFLIGALLGLPPGDVFAGAFKSDAQSVAANLLQACREDSMSDRTRILIGQALHFVLAAKERA